MADELERFHARGKAYVFLPQAFGPFSRAKERERLSKVLPLASLICARDQNSFDYLQSLLHQCNTQQRLKLFPDFTNLVAPKEPELPAPENCLMIVPNYQMLSEANPTALWRERYISILQHFMRLAYQHDMPVLLLNHEGKNDLALCQQLAREAQGQTEIRSEPDPLKVKALIAQSRLLVCSRFHGCVSALSQGVPCLGTSWSHKYAALFADYNVSHWLIEAAASKQELETLFSQLLQQKHPELLQRSAGLQELSASMWQAVQQAVVKA